MADLLQTIQRIVQNTLEAWGLAELEIGTVTQAEPLHIQIADDDILLPNMLLLSDAVLAKTIDLRHRHILDPHQHWLTPAQLQRTELEGPLGPAGSPAPISIEHGDRFFVEVNRDGSTRNLPNVNGIIYVQRALEVGDRVALLRLKRRQQYIVLFRLREAL